MNQPKPESASALLRALLTVVFHGCLCLAGGWILLLWVPVLTEYYKDLGFALPIATQWVIQWSYWIRQWAFFIAPVGVFLLLADGLVYWLLHRALGKSVARIYFWLVLVGLALLIGGMCFAVTLPLKKL